MFLAIKEIKKEKLRFFMIIAVTALIAYLVYFLSSLAFGLAQINRTAIDYWDADGIILSQSANGNIYASSIDETTVTKLNYSLSQTITVASSAIQNDSAKKPQDVVFIGTDKTAQDILPKLIAGRNIEQEDEAIISSSLKDVMTINLGDKFTLLTTGRVFTVVGITQPSNYNTRPVIYVDKIMASQTMMAYQSDTNSSATPNMPKRVSAILVKGEVNPSLLSNAKLDYSTLNTFIDNLPGYQAQVLTFGLMIVSLAIIASIIIGIFMYILTMQKRSIFGVLKIQGYQNGYIMRSVVYQAFILVFTGLVIGFAFTLLTLLLLPKTVPVAINWPLFGAVSSASLLFSMIGVFFSARSILKIDPLDAL